MRATIHYTPSGRSTEESGTIIFQLPVTDPREPFGAHVVLDCDRSIRRESATVGREREGESNERVCREETNREHHDRERQRLSVCKLHEETEDHTTEQPFVSFGRTRQLRKLS